MIKNKIHCQTHYEPLHNSKMGKKINKELRLKNVERYYNKIVRFPLHLNLSIKDLLYIKSKTDFFFNNLIKKK